MRLFGSDSRKLSNLYLLALFLISYLDSCESRAKKPFTEYSMENQDADEDEESLDNERPKEDATWSMKNVKADDYPDDFVQSDWEDILQMMIRAFDVDTTSFMRSQRKFHPSQIGIEVSASSTSALCHELARFLQEEIPEEDTSKLFTINVPVDYPMPPPVYDPRCVTWVSKSCKGGRFPSAFDPECIFWLPLPSLSECREGARSTVAALFGSGIRLNGFLANSLCQSQDNLVASGSVTQIPLKSNENSLLRCHEFLQISELEWVVSPRLPFCESINKWRLQTLNSPLGILPLTAVGRAKCFSISGTVDCSPE